MFPSHRYAYSLHRNVIFAVVFVVYYVMLHDDSYVKSMVWDVFNWAEVDKIQSILMGNL